MELKVKIIHPTVEFGNITVEDIVLDSENPEEFKASIKNTLILLAAAVKGAGISAPAPAQKQASQPQKQSSPPPKKQTSGNEHSGKVCSEVSLKEDKNGQPYASFRIKTEGKFVGVTMWDNAERVVEAISEGSDVVIAGEITKRDKYWNLFAGTLVSPDIGSDESDEISF